MPPATLSIAVGIGSSAITLLITLYIKDSARKVVEEALVKAQIDLKRDIDSALSKFREEFIRALDGTYRRAAECSLMMEVSDDRTDTLDARMTSSEVTVRDLINRIHSSKSKEA